MSFFEENVLLQLIEEENDRPRAKFSPERLRRIR